MVTPLTTEVEHRHWLVTLTINGRQARSSKCAAVPGVCTTAVLLHVFSIPAYMSVFLPSNNKECFSCLDLYLNCFVVCLLCVNCFFLCCLIYLINKGSKFITLIYIRRISNSRDFDIFSHAKHRNRNSDRKLPPHSLCQGLSVWWRLRRLPQVWPLYFLCPGRRLPPSLPTDHVLGRHC